MPDVTPVSLPFSTFRRTDSCITRPRPTFHLCCCPLMCFLMHCSVGRQLALFVLTSAFSKFGCDGSRTVQLLLGSGLETLSIRFFWLFHSVVCPATKVLFDFVQKLCCLSCGSTSTSGSASKLSASTISDHPCQAASQRCSQCTLRYYFVGLLRTISSQVEVYQVH